MQSPAAAAIPPECRESEPASTTVYGLTSRRLWATTAAVLALASVVIGGLALYRAARRINTTDDAEPSLPY
jgi:hypothetical protein